MHIQRHSRVKPERFALLGLMSLVASSSSALTIDTNPTYDGNLNEGWLGSGQSLDSRSDAKQAPKYKLLF